MEIKWKTLRFGDLEEFNRIRDRIAKEEITEREAGLYILSFVLSWDAADADTGEPLAPDAPGTLDLLSLPQYQEICNQFQEKLIGPAVIPKVNASLPSSGSTPLRKKGRNSRNRLAGLA